MRRRMILSLALAVLMLAPSAPAQASFPGTNGKLAYTSGCPTCGGSPSNRFGTLDPNGVHEVIGTGPAFHPRHMAWSRDGKRIAFDAQTTDSRNPEDGPRALFIMNADGSGLRQVGRGDLLRSDPAWSPDGARLAFTQDNGAGAGSTDIYSIATTGADARRLTTASGLDDSPDWAADGTRIAYRCVARGIVEICQMTSSGARKTVTSAGLGLSYKQAPSWSPGSSSIAFAAKPAGEDDRQVYRMSRYGASLRRLTSDNDGEVALWSPDARTIAYLTFPALDEVPGQAITTMVALDGSDRRYITGENDYGWKLDPNGWQPLR